jgi:polysaccharide export outer membrane protein
VVIDRDEISLSVAEYSPVYLNGDVSNPGSYPYRPGLTVRQAVTLAGGYDTLRTRMDNPYILAADLRSEHETLSNEYVREQARILRVETELGRKVEVAKHSPSSQIASEIEALAVEQLNARKADFDKEKKHLTEAIQSLTANLDLLEKQMRTEADRAKIDSEDMLRVEGLVAKGMAPVTRLSDTRRLVLLSASRATEIEARAEQVRLRRAEEQQKLIKLTDERRIELLNELEDAKIKLASISSKLSATTEKMFLVGTIRSQLGRGGIAPAELVVFRQSASGAERMVANDETELLPRDVVEVALRVDSGSLIQPRRTSDFTPPVGSPTIQSR